MVPGASKVISTIKQTMLLAILRDYKSVMAKTSKARLPTLEFIVPSENPQSLKLVEKKANLVAKAGFKSRIVLLDGAKDAGKSFSVRMAARTPLTDSQ